MNREKIWQALRLPGIPAGCPENDVPGLERPRQRPPHLEGSGRVAAVLLSLFPKRDGRVYLLLTRRPETLQHHPGQISLPGGRQETGETLVETAWRETREELGFNTEPLELLGQLTPLYIPPSDFTVHPFVGWLEEEPQLRPSNVEVAEVLEVSLEDLLNPATRVVGKVRVHPHLRRDVPYYAIQGHQVWGATALILGEFLTRIRSLTATSGPS